MVFKGGYNDLHAWQKAMDFVDSIYVITTNFPKDEIYGLCSQVRRSAVSIAANLAEGCTRSSTREFIRFIEIALSSLAESETHLIIAFRQKYMNKDSLDSILEQGAEVGRMMNGLRSSLEKKLMAN